MKKKWQFWASLFTVAVFAGLAPLVFGGRSAIEREAFAQAAPTPAAFDQAAAIAKLKEQIKGHEQEPAEKVFKNMQTALKTQPAARILGIMEGGYSRSLGVTCTHCHNPEKWESDEKDAKGIARDMSAMAAKINNDLLKNIKNLSKNPIINCTTCHRGQVKPALNLPAPPKAE